MNQSDRARNLLRAMATCIACLGSVWIWFLLFSQSLSSPVGPQDYGFPLSFRREYYPDVILSFPQAFFFDLIIAALTTMAVAYSLYRLSMSWPTWFLVAIPSFIIVAIIVFPSGDERPGLPAELILLVLFAAIPLIWLGSVLHASTIVGLSLFGKRYSPLFPLCLIVVLWMVGRECRPQDLFRPEHQPAEILAVAEQLSNENAHIRMLAVSALEGHGPYDEWTTSAIIRAMSDPDARVQGNAISLTRELGPSAIQVVPLLRAKFMKDGSCLHELAQLGVMAREAIPDLKERLPKATGYSLLGICETLWKIDGDPTPLIPPLITLLNDGFGPIRRDAAELLGQIGPAATDAAPILQAMATQDIPKHPPVETSQENEAAIREMTEAEFYPQIRAAAQSALAKIVGSQSGNHSPPNHHE